MSMRQLAISRSITNRDSQSLEKYLNEIKREALVTAEEEVQLAQLIRQGDQQALDKLVKANLRFVVSVAKQYQNQGLTLSDLINEGNIGLIKAAKMFDETKGFKFISYAVWWIRQSIVMAIGEQGRMVRMPVNRLTVKSKVDKAFNQLEQQLERQPSAEELAEIMDVHLNEVIYSLEANAKVASLDTPVADGEDGTLLDLLENINAEKTDKKVDHQQSLRTEVKRSLDTLNSKQQKVICYFFGIGLDRPMALEDIAAQMDVSRERIRQIKDKALAQLKSSPHTHLLRNFMGV